MAEDLRCYDAPKVVDRRRRLARAPGVVPTGALNDPLVGMIECVGHYSAYDVFCSCPVDWLTSNVLFRAYAVSGQIRTVLGYKRLDDLEGRVAPQGRAGAQSGILFSFRGRKFDRLIIEAYQDDTDHELADFRIEAWGEDGSTNGDASGRAPAILGPPLETVLTFTANPAVIGAATPIFAPNPQGGRQAITDVSWQCTVGGTLTIQRQPPVGAPTVVYQLIRPAAGGGESHAFVTPLYSAPGDTWQYLLTGGAPGNHTLNVQGFQAP